MNIYKLIGLTVYRNPEPAIEKLVQGEEAERAETFKNISQLLFQNLVELQGVLILCSVGMLLTFISSAALLLLILSGLRYLPSSGYSEVDLVISVWVTVLLILLSLFFKLGVSERRKNIVCLVTVDPEFQWVYAKLREVKIDLEFEIVKTVPALSKYNFKDLLGEDFYKPITITLPSIVVPNKWPFTKIS